MRALTTALLFACCLFAGCSKDQPTPAQPTTSQAGNERSQAGQDPATQARPDAPAQAWRPIIRITRPTTGADLLATPHGWSDPAVTVASSSQEIDDLLGEQVGLYRDYGLDELTQAIYTGESGQVRVEVFRMGGLEESFGIFSRHRREAQETRTQPGDGVWSDGALVFANGIYFIRIDPPSGGQRLAQDFAGAMRERYAGLLGGVEHMEILPEAGMLADTEMFVKRNFRSRAGLDNAVSALYRSESGDVYEMFVIKLADSLAAVEAIKAWAKDVPQPKLAAEEPAGLSWDDEQDGVVTIYQAGPYLAGATKGQSKAARALADAAEAHRSLDDLEYRP